MVWTVPAAFEKLEADLALTPRQKEVADGRVSHLKTFFADYSTTREPWAIGSYGRKSIIRWERDLDVMVVLNHTVYWARYKDNSQAFLYWLRDALNKKYSGTTVSTKQVAIRMELSENLKVDLVAGFDRNGGGFLIPDGKGGWQSTNPPFHDDLVTKANVRLGSQLKPLVRLMKAWNIDGNSHRLRSFHLEMMVERMWRSANSLAVMPQAVAATLKGGGGWTRVNFPDPWTGSGQNIDSYLDSETRRKAADTMDGDAKRAAEAIAYQAAGNHKAAIERWKVVFGSRFPAYG